MYEQSKTTANAVIPACVNRCHSLLNDSFAIADGLAGAKNRISNTPTKKNEIDKSPIKEPGDLYQSLENLELRIKLLNEQLVFTANEVNELI